MPGSLRRILPSYDRFAARQALFATASLDELPDQSRAFFAAGNKDEWTVLPFPVISRLRLYFYGSSFVMLESDDVTQLASWLFMRWMLSAGEPGELGEKHGTLPASRPRRWASLPITRPNIRNGQLPSNAPEREEITPQLASWRVVRAMLGDGFRDMFDTIRHPDLTEGQVPLILRQMDTTVTDLKQ